MLKTTVKAMWQGLQSTSQTLMSRKEKIAVSSFVANIGGLLSLFLGFSFLSFFSYGSGHFVEVPISTSFLIHIVKLTCFEQKERQ